MLVLVALLCSAFSQSGMGFAILLRSSGLIPRPCGALVLSAAGYGFAKLFSKASLVALQLAG
jgi:hypothetical protein